MEVTNIEQLDRSIKTFFVILAILIIIGVIMVYSSSYLYAKEIFGSSTHFFFRQLVFLLFGIILAFTVSFTRFNFWPKYGFYINIGCTLLVILTFFPGIGISVKGARRWLDLLYFNFQPGELIKYTLILVAVNFFENFTTLSFWKKIQYSLSLIVPLALLIRQPDYGSFLICCIVIFFVCYISTFPRRWFYTIFTIGNVVGFAILFMKPYRVERILTFLDPWKNPKGSGFQMIQSYLAFANGSIFGQGLGNGNEKLLYLPEAHNDFIFSVMAEETGFIGIALVVILFLVLIFFGFRLSLVFKERITIICVSAIIFVLGLQAFLNMGVVLGLLPTKGLNLPFISYGGSSLISNFFGIGLISSALCEYRRNFRAVDNNVGRS